MIYKIIGAIAGLAMVIGLMVGLYNKGVAHGRLEVLDEWKTAKANAVAALNLALAENAKLADEMANIKSEVENVKPEDDGPVANVLRRAVE